jgi:hypothetical protein
MAITRQLRLNDLSRIQESVKKFVGKRISLVFHDDRVITGKVNSVTSSDITIVNMRNKMMTFRFLDVAELYFDTVE